MLPEITAAIERQISKYAYLDRNESLTIHVFRLHEVKGEKLPDEIYLMGATPNQSRDFNGFTAGVKYVTEAYEGLIDKLDNEGYKLRRGTIECPLLNQ